MPVPSLARRLSEVESELDALARWQSRLPAARSWLYQLNEMRFVRATLAWEEFLEQSVCCFLCGSTSVLGRSYALAVPVAPNLAAAQTLAIGKAPFGKWLNENWTLSRCTSLFSGTNPYSVMAVASFKEIRAIRNRIVHRSGSARTEFQQTVTRIYGSTRPGMTPGRLLSESAGSQSRIEHYLAFLRAAATLIAN